MSISRLSAPSLALSLPNAHSITMRAEQRRHPKNCSSDVLPPPGNSFITYGSSGYAGSPSTQTGTGSVSGTITFGKDGIEPFLNISFTLELQKIHASWTLPGHLITTSVKQYL